MTKTKKAVITTAIFLSFLALFSVGFIVWGNYTIEGVTKGRVYNSVDSIPYNKVGLLLGTSKYFDSGAPNTYFDNRIKAAVELYKAGKIKYIVISGDNGEKTYNEPQDMKNDLIARGIPARNIYLDYAGFRTLDSVVRLKEIFGQDYFTVISQKFHNQRAIFIAQFNGMSAIGYNADDLSKKAGLRTNIRERFARVKVFFDIMFEKKPKYLGKPVKIPSK